MDLFIEQILYDESGKCNVLFDSNLEYRNSIKSCINDPELFKDKILKHEKCPNWFTASSVNDAIKYSSITDSKNRPQEWLFMYSIWMHLYH